VVSSAAYLLFYRRRSEVPLGGPRFLEIFDRFSNPPLDEDMPDSGEGQRLGQGSSLRGSPSASTGAGLILPHGNHGLGNTTLDSLGRSITDSGLDTELPSYSAVQGREDDDAGAGGQLSWAGGDSTLRNSIEADHEDEGVDLPDYHDNNSGPAAGLTSMVPEQGWSFAALGGNTTSETIGLEDDIASDVAQGDNSSTNDNPFEDTFGDDAEPIMGTSAHYTEPDEPRQPEFPDYEAADAPIDGMHPYVSHHELVTDDSWDSGTKVLTVPADVGDEPDDKVAEIHVPDDNEQHGAGEE
jgi:ubiquitin carboxyl-terminal hydrolase 4/11